MLIVAALKFRNPVMFSVLVKGDDAAFHQRLMISANRYATSALRGEFRGMTMW